MIVCLRVPLLASLAAVLLCACVAKPAAPAHHSSAEAAVAGCTAPPPLASIDVPGFYDDPQGYSRQIGPLHAFLERLNRAADARDEACVLYLLQTWARANALMAPLSGYQGYYERSWAGTDFALVLLRFPDAARHDPAAFGEIKEWLVRIAVGTRDADAINHLHNNLVYWAGLDLAAIGTVAGRGDLVDAGIDRARQGIRDIGARGELQREIARRERALHYHNFALIPLVFTAELASRRGVDLYAENDGAIRRLANLVITAVQDPQSFAAVSPVPQQLFPWTFGSDLAWMEPYYARFRDSRLPPLLQPRRPFENLRLGGEVTASWGMPLPG